MAPGSCSQLSQGHSHRPSVPVASGSSGWQGSREPASSGVGPRPPPWLSSRSLSSSVSTGHWDKPTAWRWGHSHAQEEKPGKGANRSTAPSPAAPTAPGRLACLGWRRVCPLPGLLLHPPHFLRRTGASFRSRRGPHLPSEAPCVLLQVLRCVLNTPLRKGQVCFCTLKINNQLFFIRNVKSCKEYNLQDM